LGASEALADAWRCAGWVVLEGSGEVEEAGEAVV
jgi:hypothetical protein